MVTRFFLSKNKRYLTSRDSVGIEKLNGRRRSQQGPQTQIIKFDAHFFTFLKNDEESSRYFIFYNNNYILYGFRIIIEKPKNHL